jgi:hypothetical protein
LPNFEDKKISEFTKGELLAFLKEAQMQNYNAL